MPQGSKVCEPRLRSLRTETAESRSLGYRGWCALEPAVHSKRSRCNEEPWHCISRPLPRGSLLELPLGRPRGSHRL